MPGHVIDAPVVIIGAGPSGLAVAQQLTKRGIDYQILERGGVADSWAHMAEALRLVSPFWTNTLPGTAFPLARSYEKFSALEYYAYLKQYALAEGLKVNEGVEVVAVRPGLGGEWIVSSDGREWHAPIVVCATGYYGNPRFADIPDGDDGSVPTLHARDFRSVGQVIEKYGPSARVLIIGKRVSAGQLMVELADAGIAVTLAIRSPLTIRPGHRLARMKEAAYFVYEELFVRIVPNVRGNSFPPMDGGRSKVLLRDGIVKTCSPVAAVQAGKVMLSEGSELTVDLVIHATGYTPHLPYLVAPMVPDPAQISGMQSQHGRGLYFVGLDNLRNFRSRTLRGIRDDARWLARDIERALSAR